MLISAKGQYALGLMMDLAEHNNGEHVKLKDVADRQGMSLKYLEHVSGILKRSGFIRSYRGFFGGYTIKYEPWQYTVGMILRVTEGNFFNVRDDNSFMTENANTSEYIAGLVSRQITEILNKSVDSITLQDLLDWQEQREAQYII